MTGADTLDADLRWEVADGVGRLTLTRPDAANAITPASTANWPWPTPAAPATRASGPKARAARERPLAGPGG